MFRFSCMSMAAMLTAAPALADDDGACYDVDTVNVLSEEGDERYTSWFDVNDRNTAVGNYCIDDSCEIEPDGNIVGGAIVRLARGTQRVFTAPPPYNWVGAVEINDVGVIGGEALLSDVSGGAVGDFVEGHAFVRFPWGRVVYLPIPAGGGEFSYVGGINNRGTIVGGYTDPDGRSRGLIWRRYGRSVRVFDATDTGDTFLSGINEEGAIVGTIVGGIDEGGGPAGFVRDGDETVFFQLDGEATGTRDINDRGQVLGFSLPDGAFRPFIAETDDDEVEFSVLDFTDADDTLTTGLNNRGTIVGTDATYSYGLVLTPTDCDGDDD